MSRQGENYGERNRNCKRNASKYSAVPLFEYSKGQLLRERAEASESGRFPSSLLSIRPPISTRLSGSQIQTPHSIPSLNHHLWSARDSVRESWVRFPRGGIDETEGRPKAISSDLFPIVVCLEPGFALGPGFRRAVSTGRDRPREL